MGDINTMLCFEFYACPVVAVIITLHGSTWSLHIVSATYTLILKKLMRVMPIPVATRSAAARLLWMWARTPKGHGFLSLVNIVCCQVATSRSLAQRSPTDCGASLCVI